MEMGYFNIQLLPNEILLKIFEELDEKSLLSASKVCSRWSSTISSSKLADKFELIIETSSKSFEIHEKLPCNPYRSYYIIDKDKQPDISEVFVDFISPKAEHIRKITLDSFIIKNVVRILRFVESLSELKIYDTHDWHRTMRSFNSVGFLNFDKTKQAEDPESIAFLPKLENLEIVNAGNMIGKLKCQNLKVLKIHGISYESSNASINQMLKACPNLKHLSLGNVRLHLELDYENFGFKLDSLVLESLGITSANLVPFLTLQKSSLRKIAISVEDLRAIVLNFVLSSMNLEELEIDLDKISQNYSVNGTNLSIKKLTIKMASRSWRDCELSIAKNIFNCCKSLESVVVYAVDNCEFLSAVSQNVPKLKTLKLSVLPDVISPIDNFDNLCHLEVDEVNNREAFYNLTLFMIYARNLKSILVYNVADGAYNETYLINALEKSEKLEKASLGMELEFTTRILETLYKLKAMRRPLMELSFILGCESYWTVYRIPDNYHETREFSFWAKQYRVYNGGIEKFQLEKTSKEYWKKLNEMAAYKH